MKDYCQYHVQLPVAMNRLLCIYWTVVHLQLITRNMIPRKFSTLSFVLCSYYFIFQSQQYSPLLLAAINGHERVVQILLEQDEIDVKDKSTTGYNCLGEAIVHGHR